MAITALTILEEEKLAENSMKMGELFRTGLRQAISNKVVSVIRGKGLMNATVVNRSKYILNFYNIFFLFS